MTTARRPTPIAARLAAVVMLGAIAFGLGVGALGSAAQRTALVEDGPACALRATTGLECPFCGMTHATVALGAGELGAAFDAHPLAPIVLAGSIAVLALVAAGRSATLLAGRRPWLLLVAVALVWAARLAA